MLAALLLNLNAPAPPAPAAFFAQQGGGPFLKRYEEDVELSEPEIEVLESAITQAVEAIRTQPKPAPFVLDARRIYERVFKEVHGIETKRARELWKTAVKRRIQQEDEEMVWVMLSL